MRRECSTCRRDDECNQSVHREREREREKGVFHLTTLSFAMIPYMASVIEDGVLV
jgi:hypothetical protein